MREGIHYNITWVRCDTKLGSARSETTGGGLCADAGNRVELGSLAVNGGHRDVAQVDVDAEHEASEKNE